MVKSFLHDDSGVSVIIGAMLLILITVIAAAGLALIVSQTEKQAADRQALQNSINSEKLKIASISITNGSPPQNNKIDNLAIDILNMNTGEARVVAVIVNGKYVTNYTVVSNSPDFTADVTSGNAPLTVQFSDASQNSPTAWAWDFGDGTPVVILQNPPAHTYTVPGNYSVTLKTTSSSGNDQITKIYYIVVKDSSLNYDVDFNSNVQTGSDPLNVQFYDRSTNSPTSWKWDFGDGVQSTLQNPTHSYNSSGSFVVTLTVNNGSAHMTKSGYILVDTLPNADFKYYPEPTYGMVPVKVDFIDTTVQHPTQWNWDFGDGSTHDSSQNPTHVYEKPGTYTVKLNVKNAMGWSSTPKSETVVIGSPTQNAMPLNIAGGSHSYININKTIGNSQGLGVTTDKPITIELVTTYVNYFKSVYNPPIAVIRANIGTQYIGGFQSRDYIVLDGSDSSSVNSTIVSWKWDISNYANTAHYIASGRITQFYPPTNEGYRASLTVIDNNGMTATSDMVSIPADVNFNPVLTPAPSPTPTVSPTATPSPTPTATPTVTPTPPDAPVASFTANQTSSNVPMSVQFNDTSSSSPTSWYWDFGDGYGYSYSQNPVYTYTSTGLLTVKLTATNAGGSDTLTRTDYITVIP